VLPQAASAVAKESTCQRFFDKISDSSQQVFCPQPIKTAGTKKDNTKNKPEHT
jgi:hypothetical protein